mgnify:CR=1 FL=1
MQRVHVITESYQDYWWRKQFKWVMPLFLLGVGYFVFDASKNYDIGSAKPFSLGIIAVAILWLALNFIKIFKKHIQKT